MTKKQQCSLHGGNVWAASRKWGIPTDRIIDFSANINSIGPSPRAILAIEKALSCLQHYPEPQGESCVSVLSDYLGIPQNQLILGNGGAELIYLVGRMFYSQRIMRLAPTFSEYGEGIESPNIIEIPLTSSKGYSLPVAVMKNAMRKDDLVFIGNPNNPTGKLFKKEDLLDIVIAAKAKSATVVIDEAFIDFTGDHQVYSMRFLVDEYTNLIIVGSLTKFFAVPSLRLGYAIASEETIRRMTRLLPPWRVNTLALRAGEVSLQDVDYIEKTLAVINQSKKEFASELQQIEGLTVYPSDANFILVDGKGTSMTAEQLQEKLGPKGILIRICNSFTNLSPYHFRLAVRCSDENHKLIEILKQVIAKP